MKYLLAFLIIAVFFVLFFPHHRWGLTRSVVAWAYSSEGLGEENQVDVFISGTEGYDTFRIPSLFVTPSGAVLAICEGRKESRSDTGNIDLVLKRSEDGGETWGPLQVIADDGDNVMGNPCPVLDRETGTIWMPITRNLGHDSEKEIKEGTSEGSRECWMMKSTDDGKTWSKPENITESTKAEDWTWYATGPGVGIQLESGRLLIPCDHAVAGTGMFRSHVIYSDDQGETWKLGGIPGDYTNECQAIQKRDGSILLNMRSYHGKNLRYTSVSQDGGETWTEPVMDEELIEPVCQASLIRYEGDGTKNRILFSNPADKKRIKMTVKLSYDEGESWPVAQLVYPGPSAYSCLAELPSGEVGLLYERGMKNPYEKITLARFPMEWLEE
ncbi:MAG: exo-alpha-sialidase [Candidatus Omnitrophica bacterium]|nr:exo-alpha-sialidase [Candidatus Omnitrophota bacterium]